METIRKIRLARYQAGKTIRGIAEELRLSRNTVRKVLRADSTEFSYSRCVQPHPRLGPYLERLAEGLAADGKLPPKRRRTALKLFEELQREGYEGGYDAVRRFAARWRREHKATVSAYIPLMFSPGEAYQFDWSHEQADVAGTTTLVHVAHVRLCHSRMWLAVAYPRETQEMVFDAHARGWEFFGGLCGKGIYDNMRTAVDKVLRGKARDFNSRFAQMCSHYLVEPVACTPGAGWEKGQVESQVRLVRSRDFTPRPKVESLEELNALLLRDSISWAKSRPHPEFKDRTIWEVFEAERNVLVKVSQPFDGYARHEVRVSPCALVSFDRNRYSVPVAAAGKAVQVRAYADRLVVTSEGRPLAEHARLFGRDRTVFDPWHYLPALERKPGALRNGAPFRDWRLPEPMEAIREALQRFRDWDRQMVGILAAAPIYGLEAVSQACAQALEQGLASRDAVLNLLGRGQDPGPAVELPLPQRLQPVLAPVADCPRYDRLLAGASHAAR